MKLKFIDFKEQFDPNFVIDSTDYYDNKKAFNPKGLFSEAYFGKNEDDTPIDRMGWIDLKKVTIISPIFYKRLAKIFKPSILTKIISYNKITDEFGHVIDEPVKGSPIAFQNVGIPGFIEHFEEIIDLHGNKECKEYDTIMQAYKGGILFTNVLPVFSSKLRPGILFAGSAIEKPSFRYDDINNYYNLLIKYSNDIDTALNLVSLNDADGKLLVYPMITKMQEYANTTVDFIIGNFLKGKKGIFRKIIAASRCNFSARNVLTPKPELNMCGIALPYLTFLELYRFLLINLIKRHEGKTALEADEYINSCKTKFDPKLYKYMNELIDKGNLKILLNRNPSINIGSILRLDVVEVKNNINDLTVSVSNSILSPMNADYDGDVLNITALLSEELKENFKRLSPYVLIINMNDGKFNREFSLTKDARCGYEILNS